MRTNWRRLLLLSCALLSLAASPPELVDATQVSCAGFKELGSNGQRRVLSFLQGYAHREVPDDVVGSVPIGAGLKRVLDACAHTPSAAVWPKVKELAASANPDARGEARLTRPPTEITCKQYLKLDREARRQTVYWLDGFSRKPDPSDANSSVVDVRSDPEDRAKRACNKRTQRLWWAIQGSVRSVAPAPAS